MTEFSIETMTKAYTKLRDDRAQRKKEFDETDAKLIQKMDILEVKLLQALKAFGVDSVKTVYGTVYTKLETKYTCADWSGFWTWMRDSDRLDCVEKRVSQGAMREIEQDGEELPPAIDKHSEKVVVVRRN